MTNENKGLSENKQIIALASDSNLVNDAIKSGLLKDGATQLTLELAKIASNFKSNSYVRNFKQYVDWMTQGSGH